MILFSTSLSEKVSVGDYIPNSWVMYKIQTCTIYPTVPHNFPCHIPKIIHISQKNIWTHNYPYKTKKHMNPYKSRWIQPRHPPNGEKQTRSNPLSPPAEVWSGPRRGPKPWWHLVAAWPIWPCSVPSKQLVSAHPYLYIWVHTDHMCIYIYIFIFIFKNKLYI